jgi:hypothetical protein
MPRPKSDAGTRSGRFKSDDATTAIPIIKAESTAFYRVFNGGKNAFTLTANGDDFPVENDCSLDVKTVADDTVTVRTGAAVFIQGAYDLLTQPSIRSGRFRADGTTFKIVQGRQGAVYRIFNAGKNEFNVLVNTQSKPVARHCSLDVIVRSPQNVRIEAANKIEGVYDEVLVGPDFRSGRFKFTGAGTMTNSPGRTIIDLTPDTLAQTYRYRLLNSCEEIVTLLIPDGGGTGWVKFADVNPEASLDFQITDAENRKIRIVGPTGQVISGGYDYLGQ